MSKPSRKKLCGIYCIENLANGKRYIGQSKNIERRINNHKNLLRKNEHHNEYLQRAWNKYGEDCFQFYIIFLVVNQLLITSKGSIYLYIILPMTILDTI